jgi:threonine/homoserine/homoserine lactone efflux protein
MIEYGSAQFPLFLFAAALLAFSPGPGIAYVVAGTASGGKKDGVASSLGTAAVSVKLAEQKTQ